MANEKIECPKHGIMYGYCSDCIKERCNCCPGYYCESCRDSTERKALFTTADKNDKIAELEKELRVLRRALQKAAGEVNDLNGHFNYYDYKAVTSKDYIEATRKETE